LLAVLAHKGCTQGVLARKRCLHKWGVCTQGVLERRPPSAPRPLDARTVYSERGTSQTEDAVS